MRYRLFPGTDIKASEVGFGTWTLSTPAAQSARRGQNELPQKFDRDTMERATT